MSRYLGDKSMMTKWNIVMTTVFSTKNEKFEDRSMKRRNSTHLIVNTKANSMTDLPKGERITSISKIFQLL